MGGKIYGLFLFALFWCGLALAPPILRDIDLPGEGEHPVISPDGTRIAIVIRNQHPQLTTPTPVSRLVQVYDMTGKLLQTFDFTPALVDMTPTPYGYVWDSQPSAMLFAPNSKELIVGFHGGMIRVYDLTSKAETSRFSGHRHRISSLSIGENLSSKVAPLAAATSMGNIRVWDFAKGNLLHAFSVPPYVRLAVQPNGQLLAGSTDTGALHVWNLTTGNEVTRNGMIFYRATNPLGPVAFTATGEIVVASAPARAPEVLTIDLTTGRARSRSLAQLTIGPPALLGNGHFRAVPDFERVAFNGNATGGLAPSTVHSIGSTGATPPIYYCGHMVAVSSGMSIDVLVGPGAVAQSYVAISPNGKLGATVTSESYGGAVQFNKLRVWDLP